MENIKLLKAIKAFQDEQLIKGVKYSIGFRILIDSAHNITNISNYDKFLDLLKANNKEIKDITGDEK